MNLEFAKTLASTGDANTSASVIGFAPGSYVRMRLIGVPCEFTTHFNPRTPLIAGGLLPGEERLGLVMTRVKKHRWHKKVLKSGDPLTFSLGWRRFQSIPLLCTKDPNLRLRARDRP